MTDKCERDDVVERPGVKMSMKLVSNMAKVTIVTGCIRAVDYVALNHLKRCGIWYMRET
jgi:hypothetical protein